MAQVGFSFKWSGGILVVPAKCEDLCPKQIINSTLMNFSADYQTLVLQQKDEIKRNNSFCLPSFPMEVFASQPGSVESLRKANDIPGNNSTYRNLNQHCSACARVKNWTLCQPWPSNPISVRDPHSPPNWLCRATFTSNLNISWHLSRNQTHFCADLVLSL